MAPKTRKASETFRRVGDLSLVPRMAYEEVVREERYAKSRHGPLRTKVVRGLKGALLDSFFIEKGSVVTGLPSLAPTALSRRHRRR